MGAVDQDEVREGILTVWKRGELDELNMPGKWSFAVGRAALREDP